MEHGICQVVSGIFVRMGREKTIQSRSLSELFNKRKTFVFFLVGYLPLLSMWTMAIATNSNFQSNDYNAVMPVHLSEDGLIKEWPIVFSNEHWVAVPFLFRYVNVILFSGSNVALGFFVLGLAVFIGLTVFYLVRKYGVLGASIEYFLLGLGTSLFSLPLAASHNFFYSFSGSAWILANALSFLAMVLLISNRVRLAFIVSLTAAMSYSTGILSFFAIAYMQILKRKYLSAVFFLASGIAIGLFVRSFRGQLSHHPEPTLNPIELFIFVARLLAGRLAGANETATFLGVAFLAIFFSISLSSFRSGKYTDKFFLLSSALILYSLMAMSLVGMGRSAFGESYFQASRYQYLPALFFIGLTILILWFFFNESEAKHSISYSNSYILLAAITVGLVSAINSLPTYNSYSIAQNQRAELDSIAAFMGKPLPRGYSDKTINVFSSIGHYPYNDSFILDCGFYGKTVDLDEVKQVNDRSYVDDLNQTRIDGFYEINGWASMHTDYECLLFSNDEGKIKGFSNLGYSRLDVMDAGASASPNSGFRGYLDIGDSDVFEDPSELRMLAVIKDDSEIVSLNWGSKAELFGTRGE